MKNYLYAILLLILPVLPACGGGGGGGGGFFIPPAPAAPAPEPAKETQPTVAVLTFSTTKVNAADTVTIGGIGVTVNLPAGVTAKTIDADGNVDASVVVPSGAAAGATTKTGVLAGGKLSVLVGEATNGFAPGQYVTINLDIAAGYNPQAGDFVISAFQPSDLNGNDLTAKLTNGYTADIH